jgi:hypothetical protein
VIYIQANSSSCSEHFWHNYPIRTGHNKIFNTLLRSHRNSSYLQITANVPLINLIVHAAENLFYVFVLFFFFFFFFLDGIDNRD